MTPTEHLKYQWAQAAKRFNIAIDPSYRNAQGRAGADFQGVAVTYAQVAAHPGAAPGAHGEPHDAGHLRRDPPRGRRAVVGRRGKEAFDPAKRRLALTGTPFRSDANPIPFVTYVPEADGVQAVRLRLRLRLRAGPGRRRRPAGDLPRLLRRDALAHRAGDEITATLGTPMTREQIAQAWRTALDPGGDWIAAGARGRRQAADRGTPGHAGRGRPGDRLRPRDGPRLRGAAARDQRGAAGRRAVRRPDGLQEDLRVRPVRPPAGWSRCGWSPRAWTCPGWRSGCTRPACRRRCSSPRRSAGSSGPGSAARPRRCSSRPSRPCSASPPSSRPSATTCVRSLDQDPEAELEEAQRERKTQDDLELVGRSIEVLKASATFDRVLFDGGEFGTATEAGSRRRRGLPRPPGLLEPEQVTTLLRKRQAAQPAARRPPRRSVGTRPGRRRPVRRPGPAETGAGR